MYSKYGKCKSKKSPTSSTEAGSSEKADSPEKADDATAPIDEEHLSVGEEEEEGPHRKGSSKERSYAGSDVYDGGSDSLKKDSAEVLYSDKDFEGGESGSGVEDEEALGEDVAGGYDQSEISEGSETSDETEDGAGKKKRKRVKAVMEYDIKDMYPEINILIQKKKREWDFQDPDIIRALWLETKTLALSEWKVRNAKIKVGKPSIEVKETVTVTLRQERLKNKAELQQALQERDFEMTESSRDPPHFDSIQLATNLTTDMRYKYNRNNPPVPSHYIEHFEKYKKPPFKNNAIWYVHS